MGKSKPPRPVKLLVSAFAPDASILTEAKEALIAKWGPIDFESTLLPFDHTSYYAAEFGTCLVRLMWLFERLIDPGTLADIKVYTNEMEQQRVLDGKRQVNLDSGYLSMSKVVLATTKNYGHRIYLGQGIYAEVTLHYRHGAFLPWPWTYADYASDEYCKFFKNVRKYYIQQLNE